jgi:hypothetical protein
MVRKCYPFFVGLKFYFYFMSLRLIQIEKPAFIKKKPKAGDRKWLRNQRNRYIRRTPVNEEPFTKYKGYEY